MRKSKNSDRKINGAIYLAPGCYELYEAYPCQYVRRGYWLPNTQFLIKRHLEKIGSQSEYEYFSIRCVDSKVCLMKSYQIEQWNKFISRLVPANDDSIDSKAAKEKAAI